MVGAKISLTNNSKHREWTRGRDSVSKCQLDRLVDRLVDENERDMALVRLESFFIHFRLDTPC